MPKPTQFVANGQPGVFDRKLGMGEHAYRVILVGMVGLGLQRACVVTDKLDAVTTAVGVLEERSLSARDERSEMRKAIKALADDLAERQKRADTIHDGMMTHEEFQAWLKGQRR